jgi:hypothetical protein
MRRELPDFDQSGFTRISESAATTVGGIIAAGCARGFVQHSIISKVQKIRSHQASDFLLGTIFGSL